MAGVPVAPFTGAWIEIRLLLTCSGSAAVAPFTGAWIEIGRPGHAQIAPEVAPFTGAWIEIAGLDGSWRSLPSRSLHGSVD